MKIKELEALLHAGDLALVQDGGRWTLYRKRDWKRLCGGPATPRGRMISRVKRFAESYIYHGGHL